MEAAGFKCGAEPAAARAPVGAAGGVREAKRPDCKPLFIREQSGNFATITAQMWDHFPSNKTITL